jgi:hypothetical protein
MINIKKKKNFFDKSNEVDDLRIKNKIDYKIENQNQGILS